MVGDKLVQVPPVGAPVSEVPDKWHIVPVPDIVGFALTVAITEIEQPVGNV